MRFLRKLNSLYKNNEYSGLLIKLRAYYKLVYCIEIEWLWPFSYADVTITLLVN